VVARLKDAGAVLLGKMNMPEWSFGGTTPGTNTPWDLAVTPGGSSGGSAAALAARLLPAATGGDTTGSVRQPSVLCGVVGFKATYGRVSRHGIVAISWTLDHVGPMARTVEDNALLLNVIAGYDPLDPGSANVPVPDYTRALDRGVRGVRIGIPERALLAAHHPDALSAFDAALRVLEGLGASVAEVPMPPSYRGMSPAHNLTRIMEAAAYHRPHLLADPDGYGEGSPVRRDVEAGSLLMAADYEKAQRVRRRFTREFRALFDTIDLYVMPGHDAPAGITMPGSSGLDLDRLFNLTGFPSMSVPCGFSTDPPGLPLGLQVAAPPFEEERIYAAAAAYQGATDWHTRVPAL
jgi:aspartyl-tRNA(Asn)/glutamyl-tRNA(Gln) amidotransferase subunit A